MLASVVRKTIQNIVQSRRHQLRIKKNEVIVQENLKYKREPRSEKLKTVHLVRTADSNLDKALQHIGFMICTQ